MDTPQRTCAITGTNGYAGSRIRDHLLQAGWRIRELTRQAGPQLGADRLWVPFSLQDGVAPNLLEGVDALIHCAWDFRQTRWDAIEAVNVQGSIRLFQAARQAQVKRIIFISTMSAFPQCKSMYGRAKLEIERQVLAMGGVVIRPGLIFGPSSGGVFGKLFGLVGKAKVIPLVGRGNQMLFLAHEHDLANLLTTLAADTERPLDRPVIAAHESGLTFKQILQTIGQARGKRPYLVPFPWRLQWAALVGAEKLGLPLGFRSDSLISLVNQDPHPDFAMTRQLGVAFRAFNPETIMENRKP